MTVYRKYTWNITCPKCNTTWRNKVPFFRFDGVPKERTCPNCKFKFFYREDYPILKKTDTVVDNIDDTEGL